MAVEADCRASTVLGALRVTTAVGFPVPEGARGSRNETLRNGGAPTFRVVCLGGPCSARVPRACAAETAEPQLVPEY